MVRRRGHRRRALGYRAGAGGGGGTPRARRVRRFETGAPADRPAGCRTSRCFRARGRDGVAGRGDARADWIGKALVGVGPGVGSPSRPTGNRPTCCAGAPPLRLPEPGCSAAARIGSFPAPRGNGAAGFRGNGFLTRSAAFARSRVPGSGGRPAASRRTSGPGSTPGSDRESGDGGHSRLTECEPTRAPAHRRRREA